MLVVKNSIQGLISKKHIITIGAQSREVELCFNTEMFYFCRSSKIQYLIMCIIYQYALVSLNISSSKVDFNMRYAWYSLLLHFKIYNLIQIYTSIVFKYT